MDLSDKSANAVIQAALDECNSLKLKWGDYGLFHNKVTQKKFLAIGTNTDDTAMNETERQAAWDKLIGKPADINSLILEEVIFRLEELIFGTNMIGRNVYYLLRRLMRDYGRRKLRDQGMAMAHDTAQ